MNEQFKDLLFSNPNEHQQKLRNVNIEDILSSLNNLMKTNLSQKKLKFVMLLCLSLAKNSLINHKILTKIITKTSQLEDEQFKSKFIVSLLRSLSKNQNSTEIPKIPTKTAENTPKHESTPSVVLQLLIDCNYIFNANELIILGELASNIYDDSSEDGLAILQLIVQILKSKKVKSFEFAFPFYQKLSNLLVLNHHKAIGVLARIVAYSLEQEKVKLVEELLKSELLANIRVYLMSAAQSSPQKVVYESFRSVLMLSMVIQHYQADLTPDYELFQQLLLFVFHLLSFHIPSYDFSTGEDAFSTFLFLSDPTVIALETIEPQFLNSILDFIIYYVKTFGIHFPFEVTVVVLLILKTVQFPDYSKLYPSKKLITIENNAARFFKSILSVMKEKSKLTNFLDYVPPILYADFAKICGNTLFTYFSGSKTEMDSIMLINLELLYLLSYSRRAQIVLMDNGLGTSLIHPTYDRIVKSQTSEDWRVTRLYLKILGNFVRQSAKYQLKSVDIDGEAYGFIKFLVDNIGQCLNRFKNDSITVGADKALCQLIQYLTEFFGHDELVLVDLSDKLLIKLTEFIWEAGEIEFDLNAFNRISKQTQVAAVQVLDAMLRTLHGKSLVIKKNVLLKYVLILLNNSESIIVQTVQRILVRILSDPELTLLLLDNSGYSQVLGTIQSSGNHNLLDSFENGMKANMEKLCGIAVSSFNYSLGQNSDDAKRFQGALGISYIDPSGLINAVIQQHSNSKISQSCAITIWRMILENVDDNSEIETALSYISKKIPDPLSHSSSFDVQDKRTALFQYLLSYKFSIDCKVTKSDIDSAKFIFPDDEQHQILFLDKAQLISISPVFEAMLAHDFKEALDQEIVVSQAKSADFRFLMEWIRLYPDWEIDTCTIDLVNIDISIPKRIYELANRYLIVNLENSVMVWLFDVLRCITLHGNWELANNIRIWINCIESPPDVVVESLRACIASLKSRPPRPKR